MIAGACRWTGLLVAVLAIVTLPISPPGMSELFMLQSISFSAVSIAFQLAERGKE